MTGSTIGDRAEFGFIRYASVWEDADILCEALQPVAKNGRLLSIASSGDNALALLTLDPKEVVAIDMNPTQLACTELRIAAFQELDHDTLLRFLGVKELDDRLNLYNNIRHRLSPSAVQFWDTNPELLQQGIIHGGKFERYLRFFGQKILPWIHSKWKRDKLLQPLSKEERKEFYDRYWNTWLWRLLFRVFFSRKIMGRGGRDPAFFDHVEGSVADRILARTKYALTELATHHNPYLVYILLGNYTIEALPRYLRPEHYEAIRDRIEKITLVQGPVQKAEGRFHGFNLSDIFEYMEEKEFLKCYKALMDMSHPNARLVYWNMLVPRGIPKSFSDKVESLDLLSQSLYKQDKAWFYQAFHIDEVVEW